MTTFLSGVFTAGLAALRGEGGRVAPSSSSTPQELLAAGGVLRKCWRMDKAGKISDLKLVEEVLPAPGPGEVRVKVKVCFYFVLALCVHGKRNGGRNIIKGYVYL